MLGGGGGIYNSYHQRGIHLITRPEFAPRERERERAGKTLKLGLLILLFGGPHTFDYQKHLVNEQKTNRIFPLRYYWLSYIEIFYFFRYQDSWCKIRVSLHLDVAAVTDRTTDYTVSLQRSASARMWPGLSTVISKLQSNFPPFCLKGYILLFEGDLELSEVNCVLHSAL
jgi:hypothetical protein